MGLLSSKNALKQVLLTGPESSGKTTLLYNFRLPDFEPDKVTPTHGYNYEELTIPG